MDTPLVSVFCDVYNHEPYLRECLDGIVMQKTNFPIEVIINDDASTDHSADIIREYADKYPDLFVPIYQKENLFSKREQSMWSMVEAPRARGKYVAFCEGDDYWTDPLKLQRQVDFLEANPEYSLCFHRVVLSVLQRDGTWKEEPDDVRDLQGRQTIEDLVMNGNQIHTQSVMIRNISVIWDKLAKMGRVLPVDYPLWVLTAEYGDIYKLPDTMAVYRVGSGIWSTNPNFIKLKASELSMCSRLSMVVSDPHIRQLLESGCDYHTRILCSHYDKEVERCNQVLASHKYRLGAFLLKPVDFYHRVVRKLRRMCK